MPESGTELVRITEDNHQTLWDRYWLLRRQAHQSQGTSADNSQRQALKHQLTEAHNRLIEAYLPLLKSCAIRLKNRLPRSVELDDLCSAGVFGLSDAIHSFDPSLGTRFTTFAPRRITGAMLDYLRSLNPHTRSIQGRKKRLEQTISSFFKQHGFPPTPDELAETIQAAPEEIDRILRDGQIANEFSYDSPAGNPPNDEKQNPLRQISDPRSPNPVDITQRKSLKEYFYTMLDREERLIVVLYYYEGMTMKEIGTALGISESRVSQKHTEIKKLLKAKLTGQESEVTV